MTQDRGDSLGTLWSRWTKGYRKIRQTPEWAAFAGQDWHDTIMSVEVMDRFHAKQGRTIGRWTLTAADGRTLVVFLKRHYTLPRRDGLLAWLFPKRARSPAMQEWEHLQWAAKQGIPVPRAAAAGEILLPGGRLQSFIAIEELTGMLPLHEAVPLAARTLAGGELRQWKASLGQELLRLTREFHGRRAYHRDWYFCHFYIDEGDATRVPREWRGRVWVIDLHRLTRSGLGFWRRAKDLAQLLYSSDVAGVSDRDRLEFWSRYRVGSAWSRLVGRLARMKWQVYRRNNSPKE